MNKIIVQSNIISIKAAKGDSNPKNNTDHNIFNKSWTENIINAVLFFLAPFIQIRYNEIPINKNNVVHTGPNIQLGGLKLGLFNSAYHVWIAGDVNIEPITPANWHMMIEYISLDMLFIL